MINFGVSLAYANVTTSQEVDHGPSELIHLYSEDKRKTLNEEDKQKLKPAYRPKHLFDDMHKF